MTRGLARLFDRGEDSALCDRLFVRICEVHGNGADASALTEEERTVYLVWGAVGVIGNGGFRCLFGSSVAGDPHYALTRRAYEEIGCRAAAAAFDLALAVFPDCRPPMTPAERVREYGRQMPELLSAPDQAFFAEQHRVQRGLADYVRSRRQALMHLA